MGEIIGIVVGVTVEVGTFFLIFWGINKAIDLAPTHAQPVQREYMGRSAVAMESAAPPINPGDIEVRAQVNITYRIEG